MICGIDFGARLSGNTAICWDEGEQIYIEQVKKGTCADTAIRKFVEEKRPDIIAIDAPLSLPGRFQGLNENYFYRDADKVLSAMSPMFLGGLSARSIRLMDELQYISRFIEVYPSHSARQLGVSKIKDRFQNEALHKLLSKMIPFPLTSPARNIHQLDAMLAWLVGYHVDNEKDIVVGDPEEGVIYTLGEQS